MSQILRTSTWIQTLLEVVFLVVKQNIWKKDQSFYQCKYKNSKKKEILSTSSKKYLSTLFYIWLGILKVSLYNSNQSSFQWNMKKKIHKFTFMKLTIPCIVEEFWMKILNFWVIKGCQVKVAFPIMLIDEFQVLISNTYANLWPPNKN